MNLTSEFTFRFFCAVLDTCSTAGLNVDLVPFFELAELIVGMC